MQKSANGRVENSTVKQLAKEGRRLFDLMNEAEASVYRAVNLANYRAWQFGKFLLRAKEEIGHGLFLQWREQAFPKIHERKLYRCQELFSKNPNVTELSVLNQRSLEGFIDNLSDDSVRKFRLGYVPEKERPQLDGNVKFSRPMDHLGVVNEFHKWRRRREVGHIEKNVKEESRDFREIFDWLRTEYYADE
jgi:hypothetical protein